MLKIDKLSLSYKNKKVINEATFEVDYGTIIGLLGANGSGKSTLLSAIAGVKKPDSGDIILDNLSQSQNPSAYRKNFGYVTQENPLIPELTAVDNLKIWTTMNTTQIKETLASLPLSRLGVSDFADVKVKSMSGGMKKRLALTSILMNKPMVLLMDEPFSALDMVARHDILEYVISFKQAGGIVIIASHEENALKACDRVFLIDNGNVTPIDNTSDTSFVDILRKSSAK
ncbi:MAG: ABC transporter ATP-binding protein [Eubacterium sp.]|nr:ABC transporter ATP-binding protein [Eubacterium sp.]